MESAAEYWVAKALLDWQVEMGVDEAILDRPLNRYELQDKPPKPAAAAAAAATASPVPAPAEDTPADPVAQARQAAAAAQDLAGLQAAMAAFPHCGLKAGARNLVFCDGVAGARIMIIGEAPDRDEDREGRPFSGQAGALLDKMLDAIDMGRAHAQRPVYLTNLLPWRPPQNRQPSAGDVAMMLPFLERHIALAAPDLIILMGNAPCQALLGRDGITRMRGTWAQVAGRPALPMFHPSYLLRTPVAKREAWADLLALNAKLKALT